MELQTLIWLVVGASFALYVGIAIWARAGSTSEFYVASKGIHPVLNGMATAADWMSAASFISMAGLIAYLGYSGSAYLMGWTGGYVLLALLLAPYLRKFGKFTVPDFISDRFDSKAARIIAVIALLVISLTYIIGQMRGVGIAFSRFLEVELIWGLVSGMAIVFSYTVMGGMKGITYTQIAQYVVMIFAYTVPAIFISVQLTGWVLPQIGLGATTADGSMYMLEKLNMVVQDIGFAEYTTNTTMSTMNIFLLTMALMIGTAGLPHVIVRFFTVPKVRDARKSGGWALIFIALLYTTAPAVGALAMYNLVNTVHTGDTIATENTLKIEDRPEWMKTWGDTGLLTIEDKNGDGRIQFYNDSNEDFAQKAASMGWEGNELKVDRDIMVLANPEIAGLPNWVIALVAAGGIAAALSTAAGLLLVISSSISHDLLKGLFKPDISDKNELLAGRIAMTVAILVAGYFGMNPPGFAAEVVALAFGLAASSLFPVLMMGIFYKRMNKQGAVAGMLAGLLTTVLYIFMYKGFFFIPGTNVLPDSPEGWLFGIAPQGFGTIGAIINVVVAYFVAKNTPEPSQEIQDLVESVRVPKQ
ncbi:MAG: sodium:solute symporter family protein [Campylobacterota bacterium]